jgi:hypothetical protein
MLLVSSYELGHQPLHVASPAGALVRAGHEVRCIDLAVEDFDPEALRWADAVAFSVPMHTATRIALQVAEQVRRLRPGIPICFYGLYAPLATQSDKERVVSLAVAGEYEPRLIGWADSLDDSSNEPNRLEDGSSPSTHVDLGRGRFGLPARSLLPPLDRYARLSAFGETRLAGYVEASHGCAHRCRHCPVPVVYDGRTRLVGIDTVMADIEQLVAMGARHVTFGDPDFLNGPRHAQRVVEDLHSSFPDLTFDVTAKVEHVLAHDQLWPRFAEVGCIFVVSAFESTSPLVLAKLAKGHDAEDEQEAVRVLRASGIEPRPSLLPFTPWTRPGDMADLLDLVARCDLVGNVDAVQYSIRLLLPPGSLLLDPKQVEGDRGATGDADERTPPPGPASEFDQKDAYDPTRMTWSWRAEDPRLDSLAELLSEIAERAGREGCGASDVYRTVRERVWAELELPGPVEAPEPDRALCSKIPLDERPRLTESWFCCAEPTTSQLETAALVDLDFLEKEECKL